ncbi:DUF2726 domain-containing protein [Sphingosinicella microcystinivorans]|uniref:DUF2726 domain-containing protein n=1 Tax=Sphingosinicella microcystinivorans TaxID=335406 RepID=UPI0022F4077D|nr:DUF2726 domain-containing protein [Sphingosinicella microcystinivorans]WBX83495.1 DUF2726 domain-containing protein [Sphingosinicella microcystinivorans]
MVDALGTFASLDMIVFVLVLGGVAAGIGLERLLARIGRKQKRRKTWRNGQGPTPAPGALPISITDPAEQLRVVAGAEFTKQALLNKQEARVLYAAERAVAESGLRWRVMAQVSLGEILRSENRRAFAAINSKRVDLLVISQSGEPLAAIEYQGSGHYQNTASIRDAVKKEALRKAGIRYIEVMGKHTADDVRREIGRLAFAETKNPSPV